MHSPKRNRLGVLILGLMTTTLSLPAIAEDIAALPVPEPGTMALLLGGAGAAVLLWRNRRK